MTSPQDRLQDRGWRFRNSLWVVGTLAAGVLTWASFLYIGFSAKSRVWLGAAAAYGVMIVAALMLVSDAPTGDDDVITGWQAYVGIPLFLAIWIGGFLHALKANREWLRFRSVDAGWHAPDSATAAAAAPRPQDNLLAGLGANVADHIAIEPPGAPRARQSPAMPPPPERPEIAPPTSRPAVPPPNPAMPAPTTRPPMPPPGQHPPVATGMQPKPGPIDVNTASLSTLLQAGMDVEAAERVIVERSRRGRFATMDEFEEVAQVSPPVARDLRGRLTIASPQDRQVDTPPS